MILKQINNLILEYNETNSYFTHDKLNYDINCVFKLTKNIKSQIFKINELDWILKYDKDTDNDRIDKADLYVPIIVTDYNNKLAVIDGIHRLKKAIGLNKDTILGKFISNIKLNECVKNDTK